MEVEYNLYMTDYQHITPPQTIPCNICGIDREGSTEQTTPVECRIVTYSGDAWSGRATYKFRDIWSSD